MNGDKMENMMRWKKGCGYVSVYSYIPIFYRLIKIYCSMKYCSTMCYREICSYCFLELIFHFEELDVDLFAGDNFNDIE